VSPLDQDLLTPARERTPGRHLALVGPTASGKSAVALALALRRQADGRPTELVSCDSMQVYRGMDIGTAKPTRAEQALVQHHLIDLVVASEEHNLPRFVAAARAALDDIEARGADAILVGGTGLYVRALVDHFDPPPHFPDLADAMDAVADTSELTDRLRELDPEALDRIPPGNRRRLVRALEVTLGTGRPFSSFGEGFDRYPPTPFVVVGLWPTRDVLAARIAARYEAQMAAGFLGEVEELQRMGDRVSRTAAQALGYRELLAHLRGECDLPSALERARVRTRRFAVRQQRWFGRDPRIEWFEPPGDVDAVVGSIDHLWRERAAAGLGSLATVGSGDAGPRR
jgi:tRNA dimethylallyltransferase